MSAWITTLLSSSVDGSYARLAAASWAVVVGVAIEETPLFLKIASFLRRRVKLLAWNTGGILWLKRYEKNFEAVGFVLLVLGLVLEIRFQGAAESAEGDMRAASEKVVQELRVRASDAEERVAEAKRDAASAQADAARANERAKALERDAAALQHETEEARLETARLEAHSGWRSLDASKIQPCLQILSKAKPQRVTITTLNGEPETLHLARSISALLARANWSRPYIWVSRSSAPDSRLFVATVTGSSEATQVASKAVFDCLDLLKLDPKSTKVDPKSVGMASFISELLPPPPDSGAGENSGPIMILIGRKETDLSSDPVDKLLFRPP